MLLVGIAERLMPCLIQQGIEFRQIYIDSFPRLFHLTHPIADESFASKEVRKAP